MEKLLRLLENDAKLSNAELAAMLDITEKQVAEQILEYERKGIIKGYKTMVDWEKLPTSQACALIELKVTPKKETGFDDIAKLVMNFDEVESVYLMAGGYDLAVRVKGATIQEIAMFVAKRLSTLDSVMSTATHFILTKYKDSGIVLNEDDVDERSMVI